MSKISTRKPSVSKLKKKLDAVFSRYIRTKYAKNGMVKCYTCGNVGEISNLQCGHFVSRQYLATRWNEKNCKPQCVGCNMWQQGRPSQFAYNLVKEYGANIIAELEAERLKPVKLDVLWYQEQIGIYEEKLSTISLQ